MTRPNLSKYRPVLTAEQISHIIGLCKTNGSSLSLRCIAVLAPFEYKIQNGTVSSAYNMEPVKDIESELGFGEAPEMENGYPKQPDLSPETVYHQWRAYPEMCTVSEIKQSRDYAYTHKLLSPEELATYEKDLFGI